MCECVCLLVYFTLALLFHLFRTRFRYTWICRSRTFSDAIFSVANIFTISIFVCFIWRYIHKYWQYRELEECTAYNIGFTSARAQWTEWSFLCVYYDTYLSKSIIHSRPIYNLVYMLYKYYQRCIQTYICMIYIHSAGAHVHMRNVFP